MKGHYLDPVSGVEREHEVEHGTRYLCVVPEPAPGAARAKAYHAGDCVETPVLYYRLECRGFDGQGRLWFGPFPEEVDQ